MSNDQKDKKGGGEQTVLLVVGLLFICIAASRLLPKVLQFWEIHKTTLATALALAGLFAFAMLILKIWNWYAARAQENSITEPDNSSVHLGLDLDTGRDLHLKQAFRTLHGQIIGTTGVGKSEVILKMVSQDIKNRSGCLIIDGKAEASFVNKLYSFVRHHGLEKDFRLFSLANPGPSFSFNPLKGMSAQEVTERVFSSFTFENEYYKNIQYRIFLSLVRLILSMNEVPTFALVQRLLLDTDELTKWVEACPDETLKRDLARFLKLGEKEREERVSGLETTLGNFTSSDVSILFEETNRAIDFDEAMKTGQIVYFQLPTMYYPKLAAATGKLALQCFQNAVSKRQIYLGGDSHGENPVLLGHTG